jgi:uridine kinase
MAASPPSQAGPVVDRIRCLLAEGRAPLLVAIDGQSGSGKSRLATAVAAAVGGVVVDGDDFYAGDPAETWDARSAAENAQRCFDWRRLRREALEPLLAGRTASWRPFDWLTRGGLAEQPTVHESAAVVILAGAYSARPQLADLVALAVLVEAPAAIRHRRVALRDGRIDTWNARWEAAEVHSFTHVRPADSFDLRVVNGDPPG